MAVVLVKPACIATPLIEHVVHPRWKRHDWLLYDRHDAAATSWKPWSTRGDVEIGGGAAFNGVASALVPALMDARAPALVRRQWRGEPSSGSTGNL
ncbi:hypothetical protein [Ramlibacter algicola]|uniref:Uncharacterized protein n=1 Tax=Ramlibacter algicola TaxID=2795217 RepID=A0A934UR08_9BURK|nr:hypothetical protein [Ramlibacter algicola]MBK0392695.1 hypothetical protein [Ramlibacter algicola]